MKKILAFLVAVITVFSVVCFAQETEIQGVKLSIDGEQKNVIAYNIKDNNYFKLRDIANMLKGTEAEFDVIWNESRQSIELLSNTPYSTNEELTSQMLINPIATSSYVPIYKDGATVLLAAYSIADNNYFKLRDVASAIGFGVDWNESENMIVIDTSKDYEYPTSENFGLNTKYLSFFGKTKAEIDRMLKEGTYSWEWGMTTYSNGVMIGWNSLGGEPTDDLPAVSMYIPLDKLFFNCPLTVTKDQIKSLFNSSNEGYSMMDEESVLSVNYCGKVLSFYPDYGLTNNSSAFINVMTDYLNPNVENIQIITSADAAIAQPMPEKMIDYTGCYQTDDWVEGSYIEIMENGSSYRVDLLLVRGAFFEDGIGEIIGKNKMSITDRNDGYKNVTLEWLNENELIVQSTDENWMYFVSSEPIKFYRK